MDYEFDIKNVKLIDRIWKGILDCWWVVVWYFFLVMSVR